MFTKKQGLTRRNAARDRFAIFRQMASEFDDVFPAPFVR
jgi:hypothetical protein